MFCSASLLTMSICAGVVVAVAFQQVDHAPYAQTGSKADDNRTELRHRGGEKLHKRYPPAGTFPRPSRIRETLTCSSAKRRQKRALRRRNPETRPEAVCTSDAACLKNGS